MNNVRTYIRITGLGIEKQLSQLQNNGFTLCDIRRIDLRTMEFACCKRDSAGILEYLSKRGFSCNVLPPRGTAKTLQMLKDRTPLIIFLLSALFALSCAMRCIWRIEIVGAGPYIGEVRAFLQEESIFPGTVSDRISLKDLSARLTQRLPRVAWVRASFEGLTLKIAVTQGIPMPEIETQGGNGSVIAARNGVIESIAVYAGTAAVKPGDTVKRSPHPRPCPRKNHRAYLPYRKRVCLRKSLRNAAHRKPANGHHSSLSLLFVYRHRYARLSNQRIRVAVSSPRRRMDSCKNRTQNRS